MGRGSTQWPPWEVTSSLHNLNQLRYLVDDPKSANLEAEPLGWLCRLLLIRSSGHLEQTVKYCCRYYISAKSGGIVETFGLSWLERSSNPSPSGLLKLAGKFDSKLRDDLKSLLDENNKQLSEDLQSLNERRNRIAHGENEGVGRDVALRLSRVSEQVADWWIVNFNPKR